MFNYAKYTNGIMSLNMCNFAYIFGRYIWTYDKAWCTILFSFCLHTGWKKNWKGFQDYI